jgi:cytochrome c
LNQALPVALAIAAGWLFSERILALQASGQRVSVGVYTEQQAARGKTISENVCLQCHGDSLVGTEFGPPLVGKTFDEDFGGMTAGDLFDLIQTTMPQNNPGSLSSAQAVDVMAYIFKSNEFRAGQMPLPSDLDALKAIKIDSNKSSGQ